VGDTVVLVDVQTGMGEVAKTTTDAGGHYKLTKPGIAITWCGQFIRAHPTYWRSRGQCAR